MTWRITCIMQLAMDLSSLRPQHQVDALAVCLQLWQRPYLKRTTQIHQRSDHESLNFSTFARALTTKTTGASNEHCYLVLEYDIACGRVLRIHNSGDRSGLALVQDFH
jgi:hypothetical protein